MAGLWVARVVLLACCASLGGGWAKDSTPPKTAPVPLPSNAEQDKARTQVREIYKDDLARAMRADDKVALAKRMLKQAEGTREPPLRYALLREARDLAVQGEDPDLVLNAVRAIAAAFEVRPRAEELAALQKVLYAVKTREAYAVLARAAGKAARDAAVADELDDANALQGVAAQAAARSADPGVAADSKANSELFAEWRRESGVARVSMERLKTVPDDPGANLTVGKYLWFWRGQWTQGAAYLLKGSDAALKALAQAEQTPPTHPDQKLLLSDQWFRMAERASGSLKAKVLERSQYWCQQAAKDLSKGPDKGRVEARLAQVNKALIAASGPLDLLVRLNPAKDGKSGTWTREGGAIRTVSAPDRGGMYSYTYSRLLIPFVPPCDYELQISFTATGPDCLRVVAPVGNNYTAWMLGRYGSGVEEMRSAGLRYFQLEDGKPHLLSLAAVTKNNWSGLLMRLDGKEIHRWVGDLSNRDVMYYMPSSNYKGILLEVEHRMNSMVQFDKIIFQPLNHDMGLLRDR